jgi:hypothetical protein
LLQRLVQRLMIMQTEIGTIPNENTRFSHKLFSE